VCSAVQQAQHVANLQSRLVQHHRYTVQQTTDLDRSYFDLSPVNASSPGASTAPEAAPPILDGPSEAIADDRQLRDLMHWLVHEMLDEAPDA